MTRTGNAARAMWMHNLEGTPLLQLHLLLSSTSFWDEFLLLSFLWANCSTWPCLRESTYHWKSELETILISLHHKSFSKVQGVCQIFSCCPVRLSWIKSCEKPQIQNTIFPPTNSIVLEAYFLLLRICSLRREKQKYVNFEPWTNSVVRKNWQNWQDWT